MKAHSLFALGIAIVLFLVACGGSSTATVAPTAPPTDVPTTAAPSPTSTPAPTTAPPAPTSTPETAPEASAPAAAVPSTLESVASWSRRRMSRR